MSNIANVSNECYSSGMDLNIREFPEALVKSLKMEALERGVTLRELVIERCQSKPHGELLSGSLKKSRQTTASQKMSRALTESSAGSVTTGMEGPATVGEWTKVSDGVNRCEHRFASFCDECAKPEKSIEDMSEREIRLRALAQWSNAYALILSKRKAA